MSYATAMSRVSDLQARLGIVSPAVQLQSQGGFDRVLATAQNRFEQGSQRLNLPAKTTNTSAPNPDADVSALGASLRTRASAAVAAKLTPELNAMFEKSARANDVPVGLLKAVARAESGFRADAVSHAGAQGMMQLMPAISRGLNVTDPFDPAQSIEGGARYLHNALKMFNGDTSLAVAAYNAGPGAVKQFGGIPPYAETQSYVTKVLSFAREFGLQV